MTHMIAVMALTVMALAPFVWVEEALARAGGGSSGGSRGSRSYSAPASSGQSMSRQAPAPTAPPAATPAPQRSGWGGMVGGMLGGLLLGGLLGSLFAGGAGGGGIGMLEIVVLAGLGYLAFRVLRGRTAQPAAASGYATAGTYGVGVEDRSSASSPARAAVELPSAPADLDRGVGYIRQMDPDFDPHRFRETAEDVFFRIQAAWTGRDMTRVADLLTPEMQAFLQKDCDQLRAEGRVNRLENIAVRDAELTEAWQERGQDYVTVHFVASLLDYTTDERSGQVVGGDAASPVKFEEFWTFVRPVGPRPWRLSAIQQPA